MKLKLNPEFRNRHLFVAVLMLGLACWFGYDGFVGYPRASAHDLYVKIEAAEPDPQADLEAFKAQKIKTQYGFTLLAFAASAAVALHLLAVARLDFSFDEGGFTCAGERHAFADIASVDDALWKSKGIMRITFGGRTVTLDAWHHLGVREFRAAAGSFVV